MKGIDTLLPTVVGFLLLYSRNGVSPMKGIDTYHLVLQQFCCLVEMEKAQ